MKCLFHKIFSRTSILEIRQSFGHPFWLISTQERRVIYLISAGGLKENVVGPATHLTVDPDVVKHACRLPTTWPWVTFCNETANDPSPA